jgi:hypothetical protein
MKAPGEIRKETGALAAAAQNRIDKAETQGMADITRGAGEALAATQGTGMGRAGLAGVSQLATDAGAARGRLGADIEGMRLDAMQQAAQGRIDALRSEQEGLQALGEMGSDAEEGQAQRADIDAQINSIIKANKGFFNDDEKTMGTQIANLVVPGMDPQLVAYIQRRKNAIESGSEDV